MARRTRLTPEIAQRIVDSIRQGAPLQVSAQAAGIPPGTFWEWMARGEGRSDRPTTRLYAEFAERVRKAEAEAHLRTIGTIKTAIDTGSWEAARAWLRMRWPQHYAERTEISGPGGSPIAVEIASLLSTLSDEELAELVARLKKGGGDG
jgi:hypothetical protein